MITRFRETEAEPNATPWTLSNSELAQFEKLGILLFTRSDDDVRKLQNVT
jgi:hypothetical protein